MNNLKTAILLWLDMHSESKLHGGELQDFYLQS